MRNSPNRTISPHLRSSSHHRVPRRRFSQLRSLAASLSTALGLVVVVASLAAALAAALAGGSRHALAGPSPVVGGTEVEPGEWPDVVAVLGADGSLCTGTLLDADLVLTAGHCIETNPVEVVVGSVDLAKPDGQRRAVKWSRAYPSWFERYDVGVVMLENPVLAKHRGIAQGCTTRPQFDTGFPLTVVGFGLTTPSGTGRNTRLHQATVPIMDATCTTDPACAPAIAPNGEFTAGGRGADSCFGDSGGPVYIETAKGPALLGVVSRGVYSWEEPCASGGVYVRADKVVSWIQSVSERKIERVACDLPTDAPGDTGDDTGVNADGDGDSNADDPADTVAIDSGGCHAAGGAGAGALQGGLALLYGALVIIGLRVRRRPR